MDYCSLPINGTSEKLPLCPGILSKANFISSTNINNITDKLSNVITPSRNFDSLRPVALIGAWNPITATKLTKVVGNTKLKT